MLRNILLCLDSDPHSSVFDAVVAVDSGVEVLLRHNGVKPEDVRDLVYGCIFTRGVENLKHTAVFVGGSDVASGEALVKAATDAFFGPMRVSVMLDSNGSNTTAAAAVCAARRHVDLRGALATVLAGTGAVGRRVVAMLASEGAQVRVGSRKLTHAEATCHRINKSTPSAEVRPWKIDTPAAAIEASRDAHIIIACGPPGAELLPAGALAQCPALQVAIDLNAVPPVGIADVKPNDKAVQRNGAACYGALGVGGTKMKIHKAAIARLFTSNALVLDAPEIYALGRELDR